MLCVQEFAVVVVAVIVVVVFVIVVVVVVVVIVLVVVLTLTHRARMPSAVTRQAPTTLECTIPSR